jgi:hypothetical protein
MHTDPATAAVEKIKHDHRQHVCTNHPKPGVCVSRCPADRWPCAPYRAALAIEAVLNLHHRHGPVTRGEHKGRDYCPACSSSVDDFTAYELWPCFEYLAIEAALAGTTVAAITGRELAEHRAHCAACQAETITDPDSPPPLHCSRRRELAARWRRALRDARPGGTP